MAEEPWVGGAKPALFRDYEARLAEAVAQARAQARAEEREAMLRVLDDEVQRALAWERERMRKRVARVIAEVRAQATRYPYLSHDVGWRSACDAIEAGLEGGSDGE